MKTFVFLPIVASALVAAAKPSHSFIAEVIGRQLGQDLHARSGIDPSKIIPQCQSNCTNVLKTLDACKTAACECTQNNFDALGDCLNCLTIPSRPSLLLPGNGYLFTFQAACGDWGINLKTVTITANPTGSIQTTFDPLSPFEAVTPTNNDITLTPLALIPTSPPDSSDSGNSDSSWKNVGSGGGAIGLSPVWALGTSVVIAVAVAIAILSFP